MMKKFLVDFKKYDLATINELNIENYVEHLVTEENRGQSYQKQMIGAVMKYFDLTYGKQFNLKHLYPQRNTHHLPKFITKNEVKKMLTICSNLKHLCLIKLLYGGGLRLSEVLNLKIEDINADDMLIRILSSKGNKDRYVKLPKSILIDLRKYHLKYQPKAFLFEGQNGGKYSAKSVQNVVKNTAKKAGIKNIVTPHILRHSFATHLVQDGIDIRYIKDFLGHNSIKTTEVYTHVSDVAKSRIESPLDTL